MAAAYIEAAFEAASGIGSLCRVGIAADTGVGIEAAAQTAAAGTRGIDRPDIAAAGMAGLAGTAGIVAKDTGLIAGTEAGLDTSGTGIADNRTAAETADLEDCTAGPANLGIVGRAGTEADLDLAGTAIAGRQLAFDMAGTPAADPAGTAGSEDRGREAELDTETRMAEPEMSGMPEPAGSTAVIEKIAAAGPASSRRDKPIAADIAKAATNRILRAFPIAESLLQNGYRRSYCVTYPLGLLTNLPMFPHYINDIMKDS
ncbi:MULTISPECIES: hypothetical protein [unclassified Bifidobacterium]|uniref:hypothetical protein n=1 Tax=unclassified Bifidobacterium TaxID=2608897 RepID=UPI0023FA2EBE|nr:MULTISPECIES: hypothetical protein [unclassified Bifidobacterium]WEV66033.1 hypothetical protein OZX71_01370 [Bifidobacterium sp. ESL0764]WEV75175.1 hypothetical protein OZX75_05880 [Bifidobacterium sp. ESL0800]